MFVAFTDALPMQTFTNEATNVTLSPEFPYELYGDGHMQYTSDCTFPFGFICIVVHMIMGNRDARFCSYKPTLFK